ncbi:MAG: TlyA family RNA methyltransferase [Christensenellales bacterium]|jgi:23S rRNA (cytidine1920-2'-O)/16S rRNA (cytidine1409-2'-O)-methyltransferase
MAKIPLWRLMVDRRLVADRREAERWILSGAVYTGSQRLDKPGQPLKADAPIAVRGLDRRYIGKGGYKLEGAIRQLGVPVAGRVAIDAGACTGGFTDCLIKHGAKRVYAVEVGYGQLAGSLRQHPAVVNMERTNIGEVAGLDPQPDLASVDLSYLSLKKAVPIFAGICKTGADLICLVKPLFEVDDMQARRSGVLPDDPETYRALLTELGEALIAQGHRILGACPSPVLGHSGTREFFLRVVTGAGESAPDWREQAQAASQAVMRVVDRIGEGDFS